MVTHTIGYIALGIKGMDVLVEVDVSNGRIGFEIVGLAGEAVKEAKERARSAIKNSGYPFPVGKITVNLPPADMRKEGSGLDLPIAIGILASTLHLKPKETEGKAFIGELALDGSLRRIPGVLSMVREAKAQGVKEIFIPPQNAMEGSLIDGINVYTPKNLKELINHIQGEALLTPLEKRSILTQQEASYGVDFSEVKGQRIARRAMEIAAAGGHSILLVGSPGCGKSMLAQRLPTILPPMTEEEALTVTEIYSIAGCLDEQEGLMVERPFRSPHHNISTAALIGGGSIPKPGEITLSHHGVLFMDELAEFKSETIEALRQPLEGGVVAVSRIKGARSFPCSFTLCAASNPCPCGYLGDSQRKCTCSTREIERYRRKLSGPILDRIDMQITMARVEFEEISQGEPEESSAAIRSRVTAARARQIKRYEGQGIYCNSQMTEQHLRAHCNLDEKGQALLKRLFGTLQFTGRTYQRILKLSRTIADLDNSESILLQHVAEAIHLRTNLDDLNKLM